MELVKHRRAKDMGGKGKGVAKSGVQWIDWKTTEAANQESKKATDFTGIVIVIIIKYSIPLYAYIV